MAFGYKNPFEGKQFSFGSAFGSTPVTQLNDLFDYRNYGGDYDERDRAIGRMVAGSMGNTALTDQQILNLGKGLTSMYGLVDLKNRTDGDTTTSTTWDTALNDDRVNQYLQSGDVLGATGWGGTNAGTAFGQLKANAQAAHDAGDQNAYGALTSYQNFDLLGDLAQRSMGGIGLDMFNRVNRSARNTSETGGNPFGVEGSNYFIGTGTPTYTNPNYVAPGTEQPAGEVPGDQTTPPGGTAFGTPTAAPSTTPETYDEHGRPADGSPTSRGGNPVPGGAATRPGAPAPADFSGQIDQTFREAQGAAPDTAQLMYWNDWAKRYGLDAAMQRMRNNVYTRAYQYYGAPLPPINGSNDEATASLHYDRLMAVPGNQGEINQPKHEWVNNILGIYRRAGL